jgi:CDP-diacylglycerol--glycerol-3-phosphate 3-phosphatidyltransferase
MTILPNILSSLRIALTPFFVLFFLQGGFMLLVSVLIFTTAAFTDMFDGLLARRYQSVSRLGGFLDPIADKVLIVTAFICLMFKGLAAWWVVFVIIFRDLLVTVLRIGVIKTGHCLATTRIAKLKTVAQFVAIYFAFAWLITYEFFRYYKYKSTMLLLVDVTMYVVVGLTVYTGVNYIFRHRKFKK